MLLRLTTKFVVRSLLKAASTAVLIKVLARNRRPLAILSMLALPDLARACSVCFGDPESPMAQGAVAGVYVMIGFIGFVLLMIASTGVFWLVRSRRLTPDSAFPPCK